MGLLGSPGRSWDGPYKRPSEDFTPSVTAQGRGLWYVSAGLATAPYLLLQMWLKPAVIRVSRVRCCLPDHQPSPPTIPTQAAGLSRSPFLELMGILGTGVVVGQTVAHSPLIRCNRKELLEPEVNPLSRGDPCPLPKPQSWGCRGASSALSSYPRAAWGWSQGTSLLEPRACPRVMLPEVGRLGGRGWGAPGVVTGPRPLRLGPPIPML